MQIEERLHLLATRLGDDMSVVVGVELVHEHAIEPGQTADLDGCYLAHLADVGRPLQPGSGAADVAIESGERDPVRIDRRLELEYHQAVRAVQDAVEDHAAAGRDEQRIRFLQVRRREHRANDIDAGRVDEATELASHCARGLAVEILGHVRARHDDAKRCFVQREERAMRLDRARDVNGLAVAIQEVGHRFRAQRHGSRCGVVNARVAREAMHGGAGGRVQRGGSTWGFCPVGPEASGC